MRQLFSPLSVTLAIHGALLSLKEFWKMDEARMKTLEVEMFEERKPLILDWASQT